MIRLFAPHLSEAYRPILTPGTPRRWAATRGGPFV